MSNKLAEVQGNELNPEGSDRTLIAPLQHTVKFIAILAALGVAGIVLQVHLHSQPPNKVTMQGGLASRNSFVPLEFSLIFAEWALLSLVWRGIRLRGIKLRDLIGGSWTSGKRISVDLLLGAAIGTAIGLVSVFAIVIAYPRVNPLLPHNAFEATVWVLASLNAGFCEEVAYRGYLQRQFRALTGKSVVAVLLQAIVFGFVHAFEGVGGAVMAGIAGLLFGLVAWWRNSLRPGMVAHAWADILFGLLARAL